MLLNVVCVCVEGLCDIAVDSCTAAASKAGVSSTILDTNKIDALYVSVIVITACVLAPALC